MESAVGRSDPPKAYEDRDFESCCVIAEKLCKKKHCAVAKIALGRKYSENAGEKLSI